jgi:hypothetical protein
VTRSGSNIIRGHFAQAFNFHPLGFVLHPILFILAGLALLPHAARANVARRLLPYRRGFRIFNVAFWTVFFTFGLVRWVAVMAGWMSFPANWV